MIGLIRTAPSDCTIVVDGLEIPARVGEPLLAAIGAGPSAASVPAFCGMGVCFACLVEVDGRTGVRACAERVAAGMRVSTEAQRDG
jgi:predicted molibdopterin-dependent oxidoreductase YjgC